MNRSVFQSKPVRAGAVPAVLVAALLCSAALGWGIAGHQMVTFRAVALLPADLKGFFSANMESLLGFSNEPDLLSEIEAAEGPNHYIDLDAFDRPPFDEIPADEKLFIEKFGADAPKKGRLPWAIKEHYDGLVAAFRGKDLQAILRHAGFLSHYVADATMPLHATVNYKGQHSGNVIFDDDSAERHIHVRFEIGMIDANRKDLEARIAEAKVVVRRIENPAAAALALAKESYGDIDTILKADRAILKPGEKIPADYYERLYELTGDVAARRLAGAVGEVASFWQSAWDQAGRPKLVAAEVVLSKPPLAAAREMRADYQETEEKSE